MLSHIQLFFDSMGGSLLGSSVRGIFQARISDSVAIFSSRASSQPRDQTSFLASPTLAGGFFTTGATWEAYIVGGQII